MSEAAQQRVEELTERSKDDALTPQEQQELEDILAFDRLASVIKAKARHALKHS